MKMALEEAGLETVDALVLHAPGTVKGDLSETRAVQAVFGDRLPAMTSNKWKLGHALGASGALSLEMAVLMLQHQRLISVPYLPEKKVPEVLNTVLVNAVGFGGNAVSIVLSRR
jgi:3-oxoacyl-(acyl-carrier-protein) synthase